MAELNAPHDEGCAWVTSQWTCDCTRRTVLDDLDVVAQQVTWRCVQYTLDDGVDWSDFPDLGEHTWEDVQTIARRLAERPESEEFSAAYRRLAALAEDVA